MNYFGINLLNEGVPQISNQDFYNYIMAANNYNPLNQLALFTGVASTDPRDYNEIYDRYRRIQNPNLQWNGIAPIDTNDERKKEAIRRIYAMNVDAGGQPYNNPNNYANEDPLVNSIQHERFSEQARQNATEGQPTGYAAPVSEGITADRLNKAWNKTVKDPNLQTKGLTLRNINTRRANDMGSNIDPELIGRMVESGMFGDYTKW